MDILKYTLRIADSSLILAQRLSAWCSSGPTLEEDIALTNISLDLFGQANGFLEYAANLDGKRSADDLAFKRDSEEIFNLQITEQENGHFGDTIARQFLYSSFFLLFSASIFDFFSLNIFLFSFVAYKAFPCGTKKFLAYPDFTFTIFPISPSF